jgi:streptogramin lyase
MAVRAVVRIALALSAVGLFAAGPANAAFSVVPSPNAGAGNNALNGVGALGGLTPSSGTAQGHTVLRGRPRLTAAGPDQTLIEQDTSG